MTSCMTRKCYWMISTSCSRWWIELTVAPTCSLSHSCSARTNSKNVLRNSTWPKCRDNVLWWLMIRKNWAMSPVSSRNCKRTKMKTITSPWIEIKLNIVKINNIIIILAIQNERFSSFFVPGSGSKPVGSMIFVCFIIGIFLFSGCFVVSVEISCPNSYSLASRISILANLSFIILKCQVSTLANYFESKWIAQWTSDWISINSSGLCL